MASEKVLIVDDERLVRWSLRQKCEEWGYQVSEAESGADGLRLARSESPDLVLLDVRLTDMNGLQVLERLKLNGDARAVIMITADPQLEDVKQALKQGAYDFIGKPVDYDELRVAVKNALEATHLRTRKRDAEEGSSTAPPRRISRCGRRESEDAGPDVVRQQGGQQRGDDHPHPG